MCLCLFLLSQEYVGRDVHEMEGKIYGYQVFWSLLLGWKMYCSLLFQVSPLIQPTVDILNHIGTLSISTHTWERWLNYIQIVVLWMPFVLVYMFDTVRSTRHLETAIATDILHRSCHGS